MTDSDTTADDTLNCPNCGTEYARHGYIVPRQDKPYYCLECAHPPELIDDLEALADEWEEINKKLGEKADDFDYDPTPFCRSRAVCAQELRDLIDEYDGQ